MTATTTTSSSASFRGCCCCLFLLFSFLLLLLLALILLTLLALKPQHPQFHLQNVAVRYPTPTPTPSLEIRILFSAVNNNKVGIKYRDSAFTVMYRGVTLGRGTVRGFYQPAHSETDVGTTVAVDRVGVIDAAAAVVRDASLYDRVELRVVGDTGAGIRILGLTSPNVQVSVDCTIAISPRRQALISKQCGFDGVNV